ncbi:MAG: hypothetical protein ACTTID_00495 [Bacillales bacterium]
MKKIFKSLFAILAVTSLASCKENTVSRGEALAKLEAIENTPTETFNKLTYHFELKNLDKFSSLSTNEKNLDVINEFNTISNGLQYLGEKEFKLDLSYSEEECYYYLNINDKLTYHVFKENNKIVAKTKIFIANTEEESSKKEEIKDNQKQLYVKYTGECQITKFVPNTSRSNLINFTRKLLSETANYSNLKEKYVCEGNGNVIVDLSYKKEVKVQYIVRFNNNYFNEFKLSIDDKDVIISTLEVNKSKHF